MSQNIDTSAFGTAYENIRNYPKTGSRDANDGIPSVATLARIAGAEMFGDEHFSSPLTGETRNVASALLAAVNEELEFSEIMLSDKQNSEILDDAESAILDRYPSAESAGFAVGSLNRSGAALAALAAVDGTDLIDATRDRLDGETKPLSAATDGENA